MILVWAPSVIAQEACPASNPVATEIGPAAGQVTVDDRPALEPDTALGAFAAIGCGIMVRATIVTAGVYVGTIVGAVACCGYMLFDAFFMTPK